MKNLKNLLLYKYTYIILVFLTLTYSICITNFYHYKSKYNDKTTRIIGYIHNINIDGNKLSLEIIAKEKIICTYYFNKETEKSDFYNIYKLGDYLELEGEIKKPKSSTMFNQFNYKNYLYQNKIYYIFKINDIRMYKMNNKLRYKIKQMIIDRINGINKSSGYLHTFILGDNSYIIKSIKESYQFNGISHLFAISGMHISFMTIILLKILEKIKFKYAFIFSFLIFYMFLTDFSPSVIRAGLFYTSINK